MSETPAVPQNVTDDKSSKDHKESSSPCRQEEAQVKTCCKHERPQGKERNLPDIGNKQGQDHWGCPVVQHGSCHQTPDQSLPNQGPSSQQPAGADSIAEGGGSSHQHTSNKHSDQRQISSDQMRQESKDNHPNDQEGSSHTHPSDHGRQGVLFSVRSQEQEGSSKSDHKDRKVHGTGLEEKQGRRPSRTSQDQDGRKTSKSSVHGDKEGRRSSKTGQGQDGRRRSTGTGHHGRKVSGAGHDHHHHTAADSASGLEVMADLGHSKDKPHHHPANEFKKGGWDRLNAL